MLLIGETVKIHKADALAVLQTLPDASVDAVITDPPYSSGGAFRGDKVAPTAQKYGGEALADFTGDNRDQRSFLTWMNLWLHDAHRVLRPGGYCVLFTDWRQLPTMTDALQVGGFVWRGVVPWAKPGARPMFKQRGYLNQCEYVVWGTAGPAAVGETEPLAGWYAAPPPRERDHQTQKPLEVMRALVRICPEGGTVLDPFMGSGTTGIAAVLEGRKFVGVELSGHYFDVAYERIQTAVQGYRAAGAQGVLGIEEAS